MTSTIKPQPYMTHLHCTLYSAALHHQHTGKPAVSDDGGYLLRRNATLQSCTTSALFASLHSAFCSWDALGHAAESLLWGAVGSSSSALRHFDSRSSRRNSGTIGGERRAWLRRHEDSHSALGGAERPLGGGCVTFDHRAVGGHVADRNPRRLPYDKEFVLT
jgi:hypothetical protein